MNKEGLLEQIKAKKSFLCVGLDTDLNKIPIHLLSTEDPIFEFNKAIIDATAQYAVAYKPNLAFYESLGAKGWESLQKTLEYIPRDIFTIADAKRGDIGNTSNMYAKTFFEQYGFDSVTVAPYMGEDSVTPFLSFKEKWVIVLGVTSNKGGKDFQELEIEGKPLFHHVIKKATNWADENQLMFVVGATRGELIKEVRDLAPNHFFLVPGVGAQGGNLQEVFEYGANDECGLLVNSSRGIIYASDDENFASSAREAAKVMQLEMEVLLRSKSII